MPAQALATEQNSSPQQFIINDQLSLQATGTLLLFLCKDSGLSQSLLFLEKLYPIGLQKKKLLLDKLLRDDDNEEEK